MGMQSLRATFTGVENFIDVPIPLGMFTPAVGVSGITQVDTAGVVDYNITLTSAINARVEPSALFVGHVDFVLVDV